MTNKHTRIIEITADNPRAADKIVHELRKEADNAGRWGHDVSVREVSLSELDDADAEFQRGGDV